MSGLKLAALAVIVMGLAGCRTPQRPVAPVYYDLKPASVVRYEPRVTGDDVAYIDAPVAH
jgi:hypothetical protein